MDGRMHGIFIFTVKLFSASSLFSKTTWIKLRKTKEKAGAFEMMRIKLPLKKKAETGWLSASKSRGERTAKQRRAERHNKQQNRRNLQKARD